MISLRPFFSRTPPPCREDVPVSAAFDEWTEASTAYTVAKRRFGELSDPDLIEAAIFEMKAAEKRMRFAWEKLRQADFTAPAACILPKR